MNCLLRSAAPNGSGKLSMADFFYMGGYGFFVWTSYAVTLTLLGYHFLSPLLKRRKLIQQLSYLYKQQNPG